MPARFDAFPMARGVMVNRVMTDDDLVDLGMMTAALSGQHVLLTVRRCVAGDVGSAYVADRYLD